MRVTIINQFYVPDISPTAHLAASLAEDRARRGDEVTVITSRGGYVPASADEKHSERSDNPRVYRVWTPRLGKATIVKRCIDYGTFYLGAVWRMIRLPRQDVIISLTTPPYIAWAGAIHKLLHRRTQLVLWSMDCYPDAAERMKVIRAGGLLSRLMRWMNRRLFRRLDHLICLDTAMVDLLMGQYAPAPDRPAVTVIPNWEKAELFPLDTHPESWQPIADLKAQGKFIILYMGNAGYGHHFESVLDAAEALRDDSVVFYFVGGGKRWQEIAEQSATRNLDNIKMHGYVKKEVTPSVISAADCALITLRDIALGVMSPSKLHSCLAMRLPVIYLGPERSNVDDAIQRFGCGVSLRSGDTEKLIQFVRELVADRKKLETLRTAARTAFDEAYCDEKTMPQFESVLRDLKGAS